MLATCVFGHPLWCWTSWCIPPRDDVTQNYASELSLDVTWDECFQMGKRPEAQEFRGVNNWLCFATSSVTCYRYKKWWWNMLCFFRVNSETVFLFIPNQRTLEVKEDWTLSWASVKFRPRGGKGPNQGQEHCRWEEPVGLQSIWSQRVEHDWAYTQRFHLAFSNPFACNYVSPCSSFFILISHKLSASI